MCIRDSRESALNPAKNYSAKFREDFFGLVGVPENDSSFWGVLMFKSREKSGKMEVGSPKMVENIFNFQIILGASGMVTSH